MTRDDARQIQNLASSITKLNMPSDAAAKKARDLLADMTQMSFLIIPAGPGKVSGDDVRKAWSVAGDPPSTAPGNVNPGAAPAKAATPKA